MKVSIVVGDVELHLDGLELSKADVTRLLARAADIAAERPVAVAVEQQDDRLIEEVTGLRGGHQQLTGGGRLGRSHVAILPPFTAGGPANDWRRHLGG